MKNDFQKIYQRIINNFKKMEADFLNEKSI